MLRQSFGFWSVAYVLYDSNTTSARGSSRKLLSRFVSSTKSHRPPTMPRTRLVVVSRAVTPCDAGTCNVTGAMSLALSRRCQAGLVVLTFDQKLPRCKASTYCVVPAKKDG